jgi:hypothetical protein
MKPHLIVVTLALVLVGCSSGGDGGTASIPFDPFGTEPAPTSGTEPTADNTVAPPERGASIADLCAVACTRFTFDCYGASACDPNDCVTLALSRPECIDVFRTYLSCLSTAPTQCGPYGPEAPACESVGQTAQSCLGYYGSPE